ncbi:ATP-binding protein [Zophobihabitans entericus]|uniref:histidine kinase n=1 Tax=Zophobihabitans entericus TaxID=1635327 RepID=A0A6G9I8K9_9GAMM|nr:ATP-binding protein [Zophobihabitans entericus]QIQ20551.1 hypothetical protein IPMB12_01960 [Zophobihabitans entericus]
MWRLLIRVFPLSLLSFLAAALIVLSFSAKIFQKQLETIAINQSHAALFLFQEYMSQSTSEEEWQQRLANLQQRYFGTAKVIPFSELPDDISEEQKQRLLNGQHVAALKTSFLGIFPTFYIYDVRYDKLIYIDEDNTECEFIGLELVIYLLMFIVGLFFVSFWLAFHWNELKKLMHATDQISKGHFSARANLSKFSSVRLMAEKINQMASYIERLINGQRELIHSVSHELRTPISRLSFGLELLKPMSQDPTQAQEVLSRIEDLEGDVKELSELVNELLQLATVGQQYQADLKPFNLAKMLHASLRTLSHPNQQKEITTQISDKLSIYKGDARLLERAVSNILRNADKYAHQKICLSGNQLPNGDYQIIIEDDGPGIPQEEYERIFEPFYRLENTWDKKISGYGLGLSIVQKIVFVHQGSIKIARSHLGGAKIVVQLPKNI